MRTLLIAVVHKLLLTSEERRSLDPINDVIWRNPGRPPILFSSDWDAASLAEKDYPLNADPEASLPTEVDVAR